MKKQTEKQQIEQRIQSEKDYQDRIARKNNSPKRLKLKSDKFFHNSKSPNLLRVKEYLTGRVGKPNTRHIIREYAKKNGIKVEHSYEFWTTVCDHIVDNWDEFVKFEETQLSTQSSWKNIIYTCMGRFNMNNPRTNMGEYAFKRLGIPKLSRVNSEGRKHSNKFLNEYYEKLADKIMAHGVDQFYDFIDKKQTKRRKHREKLNNRRESDD